MITLLLLLAPVVEVELAKDEVDDDDDIIMRDLWMLLLCSS